MKLLLVCRLTGPFLVIMHSVSDQSTDRIVKSNMYLEVLHHLPQPALALLLRGGNYTQDRLKCGTSVVIGLKYKCRSILVKLFTRYR